MRVGLEDVFEEHSRLFLIAGEPGIGKTCLVEEAATDARARGARVIWGRCWDGDGAPAYWPWVQVVRSCLGDSESSRIENLLNAETPQVADLLPEMKQLRRSSAVIPRLHTVSSSDPEEARFRLFDSVVRLLKKAADAEPLMIVLDDLQKADQPSLLMLQFIARHLEEARVLLIGTYRDAEVRNAPALSRLIGEIAREGHQFLLSGLNETELALWLHKHAGSDVSRTVVNALIRATAGNPLFVDGILRMLAAEGTELTAYHLGIRHLWLPDDVRETIRRRLRSLSKEANSLLALSAVIGQEFEFECLRRITGDTVETIVEALNEARREGLIHPVLAGAIRYAFSHDLIRETIYDDLQAASRLSVHLQVGEALEAIHHSNLAPHLPELAHHYRESVTIGDPAKAIDYSIEAGEAALAIYAYEEAATHWQSALALMESYEADSTRRADLLRKLGGLTFRSFDYSKGIEYLQASLELSMRLGDAQLIGLAHAELGFVRGGARGGAGFSLQVNMPESLMHLKEAQALISEDREPLALANIYRRIAWTALQLQVTEQGLTAARLGMRICERLQNQGLWNVAAANCATHLMVIGRHAEAEPLLDRSRKAALLVHDPQQSREALWLVGLYYMHMRDPLEARRLFRLVLERPGLSAYQRAYDSQFLAIAEMLVGNLGEAQKLADNYGINAQFRSQIAFRAGDFEAAKQALFEHLDGFARKVGDAWNECNGLCYLTHVLFTMGDYEGAEAALAQTFRAYRPEHAYFEMRTRPQAALLAAQFGQRGKAVEHLEVCRRILKSGENWRGCVGFVERPKPRFRPASADS